MNLATVLKSIGPLHAGSPPLSVPAFVNVYGVQESIPPAYVAGGQPARQTGNRFPGSLKGLQIRALVEGVGSDVQYIIHMYCTIVKAYIEVKPKLGVGGP